MGEFHMGDGSVMPDTEPSPAPSVDADVAQAIASDLATLEGIARGLGDGLHELVTRLQSQVRR
jgi:hypothetical protein